MAETEKNSEKQLENADQSLDGHTLNGQQHFEELKERAGLPDDFTPPTPEEEAAVIRKLDWRLLPFVFLLYMLAVLDRSNLGNAKLAGLEDAIDLKGWNYNCTFIQNLTTRRAH